MAAEQEESDKGFMSFVVAVLVIVWLLGAVVGRCTAPTRKEIKREKPHKDVTW